MYTNIILLHRDTQLLKSFLTLFLDLLCSLHFLFPSLVQTLHEFFTGFQLVLKFGFGDSLDGTILSLICNFLLGSWNLGIENGLSC